MSSISLLTTAHGHLVRIESVLVVVAGLLLLLLLGRAREAPGQATPGISPGLPPDYPLG